MTYEEAIKYLIAPIATSTEPSDEYLKQKEAYDLAIKALETGEVYMTGEDYNLYMEGYKAGKKDFEPKQGEWIIVSRNCWKCPYCQELTNEGKNFCPSCGAAMSQDITYCSNEKCENTKCERHPINIKLDWLHHSYADFRECESWKKGGTDNG